MNKLLVVEDEVITSDLLRRYFEIVGYEVINALNGADAIRMAVAEQPRVVILDIMLPDTDGYEVCKQLRANEKTRHIPIIFLTQKDERRSRLDGLELGADDYITKPFDVEELRLRVHNILDRTGGTPLVDPRTSLPNMALIKERLPRLIDDPEAVFMDAQIEQYEAFSKQYGPVAANQVIRSTAKLIGDLLNEIDPTRSFIGHPQDDHFLLGVPKEQVERLEKELPERFARRIVSFYDYPDQQRGEMKVGEKLVPFMSCVLVQVKAEKLKELIELRGEPEAKKEPAETAPEPEAVEESLESKEESPVAPEPEPEETPAVSEKEEKKESDQPLILLPPVSKGEAAAEEKSADAQPNGGKEASDMSDESTSEAVDKPEVEAAKEAPQPDSSSGPEESSAA
ncbi:MAG: response regulator [Anaerolineae bacterium]|nr:response regulator [Anaerolineae bacterium]